MAAEQATGFCKSCNKQSLLQREKTNHILHFLLTLFTCGAWVVVWALLSIKIGGWRCAVCGTLTNRKLLG
jgi:hypothetical protein